MVESDQDNEVEAESTSAAAERAAGDFHRLRCAGFKSDMAACEAPEQWASHLATCTASQGSI